MFLIGINAKDLCQPASIALSIKLIGGVSAVLSFRPTSKMPPPKSKPSQGSGSAQSPPPASSASPASGAASGETSEEEEEDAVEDVASALDSMMDGEQDPDTKASANRYAARALVLIVCLGAFTWMATDYWTKKEAQLQESELPRLAHRVDEFQGWRRPNLVGFVIMTFFGAGVVMIIGYYRRVRAEKARRHDSVFWFLSSSSLLSLAVFILYRRRERRRSAARKAMKYAARHPSRIKHYFVGTCLVLIVLGLLYYRRRMHAKHMAKRKIKAIKQEDVAEIMPANEAAPTTGAHGGIR